jgi:hypothetical protein
MTASARRWILAALFTSGLAGLSHEIAWARLLSNLIVQHRDRAGGRALGLHGRPRGRRRDLRAPQRHGGDPLATYVRLEIGIAIYCALLPLIVRGAGAGYEAVAAAGVASGGVKVAARIALAVIAVLLPALMMGGTLPIAARALIREVGETRREVASVYAWNNIGAVLGAGLTGFWVLPALGIQGSLLCASSANLAAAGLAVVGRKSLRAPAEPQSPAARAAEPLYSAAASARRLVALFLSGFAALGYEVAVHPLDRARAGLVDVLVHADADGLHRRDRHRQLRARRPARRTAAVVAGREPARRPSARSSSCCR